MKRGCGERVCEGGNVIKRKSIERRTTSTSENLDFVIVLYHLKMRIDFVILL